MNKGPIDKKAIKNSYCFFENKDCEYFPCHQGLQHVNCLFCYCPLYLMEDCMGNPVYIEKDGKKIKDCKNCTFPHQPDNYNLIIQKLKNN